MRGDGRTRTRAIPGVLALMLLGTALTGTGRATITPGQVDTFQGGTTLGWTNGGNAPDPVVVLGGGPAGAGDNYLRIAADGSGAGGRLTVFNPAQWSGNYVAAGVTSIEMDLLNLGTAALSMRIALKNGSGFSPGYSSTVAFSLPADGAWHHAAFALNALSLTPLSSPPTLSTLLASVGELRILNAAAPALNGDFITTQVGIDNIRAVTAPVPEPGGLVLIALGGGLIGLGARYGRRCGPSARA